MLELTRPIASLDLETTGVDVEHDRIVEIGIVRTDERGLQSLVFPGRTIPEQVSAIHGIRDVDVQDAPTFEDLAPRILEVLDGCDIVTYNGRTFDVPMLSAEFKRVGIAWPPPDMVQIDVRRVWERQEPRTLAAAVSRWLGIAEYDGHRAISDASKTLAVLQEIAKRYDVHNAAGLADLERDPDWVDIEGKFKRVNGVITITIGQKWKDKPLSMVDDSFLGWMLGPKATFAEDTKAIVRAELERRRRMADDAAHDYEHPLLDVTVPANWSIR